MASAVLMEQKADVENNIMPFAGSLKLLTIKQFCLAYPWPSESAMRSYVYRAKDLGLAGAFIKFQKRVLVNPNIFFALIQKLERHSIKGNAYEVASQGKGEANY